MTLSTPTRPPRTGGACPEPGRNGLSVWATASELLSCPISGERRPLADGACGFSPTSHGVRISHPFCELRPCDPQFATAQRTEQAVVVYEPVTDKVEAWLTWVHRGLDVDHLRRFRAPPTGQQADQEPLLGPQARPDSLELLTQEGIRASDPGLGMGKAEPLSPFRCHPGAIAIKLYVMRVAS